MNIYNSLRTILRAVRLPLWGCCAATVLLLSCASEGPKTESATETPAAARIVSFYPGQPAVAPGDQAQFCYGVENAVSVRLEPAVEEIRPLTTKCVWFKPESSMKLTLIATGADGKDVRETIDITVKAGAPPTTSVAPANATPPSANGGSLIATFVATTTSIPAGGSATVCYELREPATVTMQPASGPLDRDLKKCILLQPKTTTTYTLSARAGAKTDSASVTINVQ